MSVRIMKPTSPGTRHQTYPDFAEITKTTPERKLVESKKKTGGRNAYGRVTVRYRGGGHRRKYRMIDFKRDKTGIPAKVSAVEYDPNRSARIALLTYADGEKRYILAPAGVNVGDSLMSGASAEIRAGNALALKDMPVGTVIHNVEIRPGQGGRIARSAGAFAQLIAREDDYCQVRCVSGEVRRVPSVCMATIGAVGFAEKENIKFGKAGRQRWRGRRPRVRGVAMNPVDHPLGGGEGKSSGGRPPVSPWGKPEGVKTRKNRRTDRFIVKRRK